MGLLEHQVIPSLRDVAHDGFLCTLSNRSAPDRGKWCGPSGQAAWTVHHVQITPCWVTLLQPASQAEFLDKIRTKVFRVFLLAIHSHLYSFALRFLFPQTHATSYSFYSSATVHCKGERRKT
jgi:hypothetical protein